jgi:hypothetical protein
MNNSHNLKVRVFLYMSGLLLFLSPMYLSAQLPYTPPEGGQIQSMPDPWFRYSIEAWRIEYNSQRPHSALNYQTPDEFIKQIEQQKKEVA